jgi:2-C-methyl-D-erythritol 4-phosphate cytidylyltransferase
MQSSVSAILLAAGRGTRIGAKENKVYIEIEKKPLLSYALNAFSKSPLIDEIVLVVAAGEERRAAPLIADLAKEVRIVRGGTRRQDSSRAGVEGASGKIVLIHDAARPFPSQALIARVISGVKEHGACVPVLSAVDTLRYRDEGGSLLPQVVTRRSLLQIQTPQGFRRELIRRALDRNDREFTDDAGAVLETGEGVWTVPGERVNLKVTTREDLNLARALAAFLAASDSIA